MLAQLVHDPVLLAWIGTVKGLAFVGVTSFSLYLLLRVWGGAAKGSQEPVSTMRIGNLIALFIGLSLIVPLLGYSIFRIYSPQASSLLKFDSCGQFAVFLEVLKSLPISR